MKFGVRGLRVIPLGISEFRGNRRSIGRTFFVGVNEATFTRAL